MVPQNSTLMWHPIVKVWCGNVMILQDCGICRNLLPSYKQNASVRSATDAEVWIGVCDSKSIERVCAGQVFNSKIV